MPARYPCEMYGQIFYSPELSYNDLYAHEHRLVDELTEFLNTNSAMHLDFTPDGDSLRFQCELDTYGEDIFHQLADGISAIAIGRGALATVASAHGRGRCACRLVGAAAMAGGAMAGRRAAAPACTVGGRSLAHLAGRHHAGDRLA